MGDYTKEQLHKLYRDLVINRSTRPMTTKELRDNTSYINEDWEEAFDNRQLTPEQEDKAIAIRYNYPRDTKTAAFDALNTLFGDLQDALYTQTHLHSNLGFHYIQVLILYSTYSRSYI